MLLAEISKRKNIFNSIYLCKRAHLAREGLLVDVPFYNSTSTQEWCYKSARHEPIPKDYRVLPSVLGIANYQAPSWHCSNPLLRDKRQSPGT